MAHRTYMAVEDLDVYRELCQLHLEVCDLTHQWPAEERYELGSQVRRSSNSSPSQLAEKNDDRHVRNKIEGENRSRGEAGETVHHLYMALLKKYISQNTFQQYRQRYQECVRMLNGLAWTIHEVVNSPPLRGRDVPALRAQTGRRHVRRVTALGAERDLTRRRSEHRVASP